MYFIKCIIYLFVESQAHISRNGACQHHAFGDTQHLYLDAEGQTDPYFYSAVIIAHPLHISASALLL
jgi:hypothetical protein